MMSPERIAAGIDDRFRLLSGGSRTAMSRQQTLEASVAWSYDLLSPDEQQLARRLSVMHGFTLEAAEGLAGDDIADRYAVLDVLTRLVDKSMVQVDHATNGQGYRFLDTVRQYLLQRLAESRRGRDRARPPPVVLRRARRADCAWCGIARQRSVVATLESQHANLESALEFAIGSDRRESALRLATAMALFWSCAVTWDAVGDGWPDCSTSPTRHRASIALVRVGGGAPRPVRRRSRDDVGPGPKRWSWPTWSTTTGRGHERSTPSASPPP